MTKRIPLAGRWLLLCGIGLSSCMSYTNPEVDPYFAGYHAANPARRLTETIPDRAALNEADALAQATVPAAVVDTPGSGGETYTGSMHRNLYRDPYYRRGGSRLNLSYHLYGPYHYRGLRSRLWLRHHQRWNQLPWYAYDPFFDAAWWHDPWYGYGQYGAYLDPWYAYGYDPWYFDPWYYDPYYAGYVNAFGPYYGWRNHYHGSSWYRDGGLADASNQNTSRTRRPRNRWGLPTGSAAELASNTDDGSTMTKVVASGPGSSGSWRGSATTAKAKSSGSASAGKQARGANRRGSAARPRKEQSSAGSTRQHISSRSKSSKGSNSGKTRRSRDRKP